MALIGTSVNIEKKRLDRFQHAAESLNLTETELLSILIEKSRAMLGDFAVTKQSVRYQRGIDPADYAIHHINFTDIDYEFATSRRYLFKISVSFLIRLAIDLFLEEIINEWTTTPILAKTAREAYITNSHYQHFDIDHFINDSSELWVIPWPRGENG